VKQFGADNTFDVKVCVTAQHRHMLDQVLDFFEIQPDYDLDLMKPQQDLFQLSANVLTGLKPVLEDFKPDYVFVHGDTTTSSMAALAAFYAGAKVCHVEAGLRTFNKYSPFPEEMNRQLTGRIADIHFAPTESSCKNLMQEGVDRSAIVITGNTVIDALYLTMEKLKSYEDNQIIQLRKILDPERKTILVTGHRRENFGEGFTNICLALKDIATDPDVQIIFPVHLNPNVSGPVYRILDNINNIHLIEPLSYPAFTWLMSRAYLIITDSGGVQEEAPGLGKPVLVMRDTTERPEAVAAGTVRLVGASRERIVEEARKLLTDPVSYDAMSHANNPYGDGLAAERIVNFLAGKYSTV